MHSGNPGGRVVDKLLADIIFLELSQFENRPTFNSAYDATLNPLGQLLSIGLMTRSGSAVINGGTGNAPTNWFMARYPNSGALTAAAPKLPDADGPRPA